jgi:hypothetical protein
MRVLQDCGATEPGQRQTSRTSANDIGMSAENSVAVK